MTIFTHTLECEDRQNTREETSSRLVHVTSPEFSPPRMPLALSAVKGLVFGIMLTHMTSGMGDGIFIYVFYGLW